MKPTYDQPGKKTGGTQEGTFKKQTSNPSHERETGTFPGKDKGQGKPGQKEPPERY